MAARQFHNLFLLCIREEINTKIRKIKTPYPNNQYPKTIPKKTAPMRKYLFFIGS